MQTASSDGVMNCCHDKGSIDNQSSCNQFDWSQDELQQKEEWYDNGTYGSGEQELCNVGAGELLINSSD